LLLCLLAAVHVFIFSAAFPFFNNVDEQIHFDLAIKYSQGHVPRGLEPVSADAVHYIVLYGSPEFVGIPASQPGGTFPPPPWTQPLEKIRSALVEKTAAWQSVTNYETSQPPVYYALAAGWWNFGKAIGLHDGFLLYWLRFLNVIFIAALVWLGFAAARLVFPGQVFLRLGVPALIAFLPQTAFYSVQNDALLPLCFGAAFIGLVKILRAEIPGIRLGIFTGLALAAAFLTKISSLPLLAVAAAAIFFKAAPLAHAGKFRAALPSLAALALCAALPMAAWLAWCKINFGDFTGTAAKIEFLGWTHKPFAEWWPHPIFTPHGLWTFLSGLLATFWQGEFLWHRQPLAFPLTDGVYSVASLFFVGLALPHLLPQSKTATPPQQQALRLGFGCFAFAVAFLGLLSVIYDFHDCFYPSREHPYFTSGRLMLGALIPFLLLFVSGLDRALSQFRPAAKFTVLALILLLMLGSEIAVDWPVFANPYNWFHL
jgi:hypothetical protein